jgi:transposase InsO family protein
MAAENSSRPPQLSEHGGDFHEWQMRFKFWLRGQGKEAALTDEKSLNSSRVLGWIGTSVPSCFLLDIDACKTASAAWQRLEELFTEKNQANLYALESNYNELSLGAKETIAEYFTRAQGLRGRLKTAGIDVDDSQLTRRLLKGLPSSYNTYRVMALHGAVDLPKLADIKAALMALEADDARTRRKDEIALAAVAGDKKTYSKGHHKGDKNSKPNSTSGTGGGNGGSGDRSKMRCQYCKKLGHHKDECYKKKKSDERLAAKKAAAGGSNASPQQPIMLCSTLASGPFTLSGPNVWVADTGASAHLTSFKGLLREYAPCSTGNITYGNDSTGSYRGTGNVLLQSEPPGKQLVLTGVRYVPDNRYNVVSLPSLMLKGVTLRSGTTGGRPSLDLIYCNEVVATAVVYPEVSILLLKCTAVSALQPPAICASSSAGTPAGSLAAAGSSLPPSGSPAGADVAPAVSSANLALRDYYLWHKRLGHPSLDYLTKAVKLTSGIGLSTQTLKLARDVPCDICIRSKQQRLPFPASSSKTSAPLELIHMDLCGPLTPKSRQGYSYFLTLLDEHTSYSVVRLLVSKSDASSAIQAVFNRLANLTGQRVKAIRTDNGGEFLGSELSAYLSKAGIQHQKTAPYTPQQNGKAERLNKTLMTAARSLLADCPLSKIFWGEALLTANYLRNVLPASGKAAVPHALLFGATPDLSHLRQFGCTAYVLTPKHQRAGKLDPVSASGLFVGYPESTKGYKIFFPETDTVVVSRDVRFIESASSAGYLPPAPRFMLPSTAEEEETTVFQQQEQSGGDGPDGPGSPASPAQPGSPASAVEEEYGSRSPSREQNYTVMWPEDDAAASEPAQQAASVRRSSRANRGVPSALRFGDQYGFLSYSLDFCPEDYESFDISQEDYYFIIPEFCLSSAVSKDPTFKEAMASPEREHWLSAIRDELTSLQAYNTWTQVPTPAGIRLIPTKYVLKKKFNAKGEFERYKARLVVQGFRQQEGIDYNETFSPTSRYSTMRTLFSKAASEDLELDHLDIKTAFLNGELDEDIYISYPPGFSGPPGHCLKLNKSLYGLKQAPRQWHLRLESELKSIGFSPSYADPALFISPDGPSKAYLLVYVDDIIIATKSKRVCQDIKGKLLTAFDGRDLGPVTSFLGINITRDRANRSLSLDQTNYVKELLITYKMTGCKPKAVPMDPGLRLSLKDDQPLSLTNCPYGSLVGSLMYLAVSTRPDIAYTVGALARFMSQPTVSSMGAAKALLRYLAGTSGYRLSFSGSSSGHELAIYTDSDYAACPDTRRSVSGFVITLNGGAVDWRSKKQTTVTLSTTEAEYMAAAAATREVLWFRQLSAALNLGVKTFNIYGDNKSTLQLIKNPILSHQSKHIDIACHFLRERAARGEVSFSYVPTDKMLADVFTKALPKNKHEECCRGMGVT